MLKDFFRRLFFKHSTTYFLCSFISACAQVVFRVALFVVDNNGAQRTISEHANSSSGSVTQMLYSMLPDGGLESCANVPGPCKKYTLDDIRKGGPDVGNSTQLCAMVTVYSSNVFRENSLEDVAFIAIHVYLLFVAIYAIARESIPHVITIFGMHCLSLIWALARVVETIIVENGLSQFVKAAGCGSDFFGTTFFTDRHIYEGSLFIVSLLSIIVEAFAACKLKRVYSTRPWRVVQVSGEIRKMYRLLLGFSVVIQMAGLILSTVTGLWVYQLMGTDFSHIVGQRHIVIYDVFYIFVTIALPLWIALGWYSLRREWPRATLVFLVLGFIILGCCIAVFDSAMFLWAYTTWWFFGALCTLALTFMCAALVLALFCRRNFGNNLDHYLIVQNRLSAMGFAHGHFEKDDDLDEKGTP